MPVYLSTMGIELRKRLSTQRKIKLPIIYEILLCIFLLVLRAEKDKTQQGHIFWQECKLQFSCCKKRVAFKPTGGQNPAGTNFLAGM